MITSNMNELLSAGTWKTFRKYDDDFIPSFLHASARLRTGDAPERHASQTLRYASGR